jgi:L-alanine-DL-glutamate epimerase-like enolase superfamily enzyme
MEMGYSLLKMDVGLRLCSGTAGTVCATPEMRGTWNVMHPFTAIRLTEKGLEALESYCAAVREAVGYEVPLASDHFGRTTKARSAPADYDSDRPPIVVFCLAGFGYRSPNR